VVLLINSESRFTIIQLLHSDKRTQTIDEALHTFQIKRSLSRKGCPNDNAVAEAAFKVIKTESIPRKIKRSQSYRNIGPRPLDQLLLFPLLIDRAVYIL
jgi:transposase InsO family protein